MAEGNATKDESEFSSEDDDDVIYDPCFDASLDDMSGFDTFLRMNKPSFLKRSEGIGWIYVRGPKSDFQRPALSELFKDWKAMQKNYQEITPKAIFEMAKKHYCLCGKWLFMKETGFKIDRAWAAIARAVAQGQCGISAKVSPINDTSGVYMGRHVVCVYNSDFTNMESVEKLEHDIRKTGLKCCLAYKPDVYTYLNIYRNNKWAINQMIYGSEFDLVSGKSKIVATFDKKFRRNTKSSCWNRPTEDRHEEA